MTRPSDRRSGRSSPERTRSVRSRSVGVGAGLAFGLVLAACSGPSVPSPPPPARKLAPEAVSTPAGLAAAVAGGTFVRPVALGGLVIEPPVGKPPAAPLGLDLTTAREYVALAGGIGTEAMGAGDQAVGYGDVTLTGVTLPAGTPTLHVWPAWVGISLGGASPVAYSCPAEIAPPRTTLPPAGGTRADRPIDSAVIFYGPQGRGAVLYRTAGAKPCGEGTAAPSVAPAQAVVPVPWQLAGPVGLATKVSYVAPACASLSGVGASGNVRTGVFTASVTVAFPFDRTRCDAVSRFETTVRIGPIEPPPPRSPAPAPPGHVVLEHAPIPVVVPPGLVGPIT